MAGFLRESQIVGARGGDRGDALVPVSHATLWRWVKAGKFPRPVKLGDRVTAWNADEVRAWLAARCR